MSDRKTRRLLGAEYRKRKLHRDAESRKNEVAIKKFLFSNDQQAEMPSSSKSTIDIKRLPTEGTYDEKAPDEDDTRMKGEDKAQDGIVMKIVENIETTKKHTLAEKFLSDDPATWPSQFSNNDEQYLVQNKSNHRIQLLYPKDNDGRSFSDTYFMRI